jgi:hypothetical protein
MASKFSMARPIGSITPWHWLQPGFERWLSSLARSVFGVSPLGVDKSVSTSGGGGVGGVPISLSMTHAPRSTGDVRSPYDVRNSMAPLPSTPHRRASSSVTRRNCGPSTDLMP